MMTRINVSERGWSWERVRQFLKDNPDWHIKVIGFDVFVQRGCDA